MKDNINGYCDVTLQTEDGQFQLIVDNGFTGTNQYQCSLHSHACYELFYVAKGTLQVVLNDCILIVESNSIFIIPPDTLHHTWSEDSDIRWYILSFQVINFTEKTIFADKFRTMQPITFQDDSEVSSVFLRLSRYARREADVRRSLMAACFYELLYLLKEEMIMGNKKAQKQSEKSLSLIANSIDKEYRNYVIDDYINQNFAGEISLTALAEKVYLSERHINRILLKIYGQTFKERVIYLRIQNAAKLLMETGMTVKSIAEAVGYHSIHTFYYNFEKIYHTTPEAYRKDASILS